MPAMPIASARLRLLPVVLATLSMLSLAACAPGQERSPETAPTATAPEAPADMAAGASPGMAPAPVESTAPAPSGDAASQCDAAKARSFVGKDATDATVAQAQAAAGAKGEARVIKPGQPVTMDFRADRLNVEVDERNIVTRFTCG